MTNAPSEGLPPGCTCVVMAPGTLYEARVLNPACPVHRASPERVMRYRGVSKCRQGFDGLRLVGCSLGSTLCDVCVWSLVLAGWLI
jgi:hypothetical protein